MLVYFNKADISKNESSYADVRLGEVYFGREDSERVYSAIIVDKNGEILTLKAYLGDIINLTLDTTDYDSVIVRGVSL